MFSEDWERIFFWKSSADEEMIGIGIVVKMDFSLDRKPDGFGSGWETG